MTEIFKKADEISGMKRAGQSAAQVLTMIEPHVVPGVSTADLDRLCHEYMVDELKVIPAPLNYRGFPKSICTSVNHVICHGIPSEKKILRSGDIINIDVTVIQDGYHGDTSCMFVVGGQTSTLAMRLIQETQMCLYLGISAVKNGAYTGDIGYLIQTYAHQQRFSVVREYCGHGIGRVFHSPDLNILHYGRLGDGTRLETGMTFTIEPMLNAGKRHNKVLHDQWTVVTKDKSLSAQWEHTLIVTTEGCDILTRRSDEDSSALLQQAQKIRDEILSQ